MEHSGAFVCLMGIGTVFVGLICIVLLCKAMSALCQWWELRDGLPPGGGDDAAAAVDVIPRRQEMIAAVSAVIAEELGVEVNAIRVLKFERV